MLRSLLWQRFFEKVNEKGPIHPILKTRCWLWLADNVKGYGRLRVDSKLVQATHIAYKLFKGEISLGHDVLHSCDNPECVNPEHLFTGTHQANMVDKCRKGRQAKGIQMLTTLTEDKVRKIRIKYKEGKSRKELQEEYLASETTIYNIVTFKSWKHVK